MVKVFAVSKAHLSFYFYKPPFIWNNCKYNTNMVDKRKLYLLEFIITSIKIKQLYLITLGTGYTSVLLILIILAFFIYWIDRLNKIDVFIFICGTGSIIFDYDIDIFIIAFLSS